MLFRREGLTVLGVVVVTALASAIGSAGASETDPTRPAAGQPPASLSSLRRREIDELRRRDIAQALADQGIPARWQDHRLAELADWCDRIDAARALHSQYGTDVDWRALSLAALTDMRLRAAKAAELQSTYKITVDWRAYAWGDLERLRRSLAAIRPAPPATPAPPKVAAWDADALAPFDPARPTRRAKATRYDPDAIIEPLFASEAWSFPSRRSARFGRVDPDAILAPTFEKIPPHVGEGDDDLIDPWNAR
jgi:hypothetical protein